MSLLSLQLSPSIVQSAFSGASPQLMTWACKVVSHYWFDRMKTDVTLFKHFTQVSSVSTFFAAKTKKLRGQDTS